MSNTESASLGTVSALGLLDHSAEDRLRAGADGEAGAATHDTHMNAESFPGMCSLSALNFQWLCTLWGFVLRYQLQIHSQSCIFTVHYVCVVWVFRALLCFFVQDFFITVQERWYAS